MTYQQHKTLRPIASEVTTPSSARTYSVRPAGGVRSVLKRLRAHHGPAWVVVEGRKVAVRLIGAVDGEPGQQQLSWESAEAIGRGPVRLEFFGPAVGYQATIESHGERAGSLVTSMPTHFESVRVRREPRFPAPHDVRLSLRDAPAGYPLLNMSDRGLAFRTDDDAGFLQIGDRFDADVSFMGALRVRVTFTVRHVSEERAHGKRTLVGGSLSFATEEDESRWHEQVDAVRHSLTQVGKLFTRDMWELFESAGYFALSQKNNDDFVRYREAFMRTSRYLSAQPEHGVQVVFPSARGIEATASVVAEAENTAVIYHVAKRPGDDPRGISGKIVLRSVYEHALTWARRREVHWVSAWVQDVTRFSCGLHREFCAAHARNGNAGVFTFRALEIAARKDAPLHGEFTLSDASEDELAPVLAAFRARHPHPIGEARAWHPAAFANPSSLEGRSMPRQRRVVLAHRDGELRAAAIFECAQPGVHLFGIFDSCYVLRFSGSDEDGALEALLDEGARWYAARNKTHFVYACADLARNIDGARDLGVTHESIFSIDLMSKFLEHLWQLTAEGT